MWVIIWGINSVLVMVRFLVSCSHTFFFRSTYKLAPIVQNRESARNKEEKRCLLEINAALLA